MEKLRNISDMLFENQNNFKIILKTLPPKISNLRTQLSLIFEQCPQTTAAFYQWTSVSSTFGVWVTKSYLQSHTKWNEIICVLILFLTCTFPKIILLHSREHSLSTHHGPTSIQESKSTRSWDPVSHWSEPSLITGSWASSRRAQREE